MKTCALHTNAWYDLVYLSHVWDSQPKGGRCCQCKHPLTHYVSLLLSPSLSLFLSSLCIPNPSLSMPHISLLPVGFYAQASFHHSTPPFTLFPLVLLHWSLWFFNFLSPLTRCELHEGRNFACFVYC